MLIIIYHFLILRYALLPVFGITASSMAPDYKIGFIEIWKRYENKFVIMKKDLLIRK